MNVASLSEKTMTDILTNGYFLIYFKLWVISEEHNLKGVNISIT